MNNGNYNQLSGFGIYLSRFIENMQFGVDVFFLISGFLITYLLMSERNTYGRIDFKKFYMRRMLRIWPLYFFTIALSPFIVSWLGETPPDYIPNLLFYNNFHAIHTEAWTYPFAHFWSICVEHFYVLWPLVIAFVPIKKLPTAFAILIFFSIMFRAGIMICDSTPWWPLFMNTFSRMDALVLGSLFGYMHAIKPLKVKVPGTIRILLYLLFLFVFVVDIYVQWDNIFLACIKKYFYMLIAGFAMMNYLFNPDAKFVIKKKNVFHYFGKISYGIYIYHNIFLLIVIKKIMINYNLHNMYLFFLIMFTGSIIIPIISYELYEKWFLKLKARFEIIRTSSTA